MLNPLSIGQTAASNGTAISDDAEDAIAHALKVLSTLQPQERVVAFTVLGDYFCRWCGIEQPPGDCQCRGKAR